MKLIVGAAQFGSPYGITNYRQSVPDEAELKAILDYAYENGIESIDTAEAYGNANERLQACLKRAQRKFKIINKILRFPLKEKSALDLLKNSLLEEKEKFGGDAFDCIMLHHAPSLEGFTQWDFLESLKAEGLCKKIGLSINKQEDYFLVSEKLEINIIQAPFNLLNQNILDLKFVNTLTSRACHIHVRSVFLQGLLLTGCSALPDYLEALRPFLVRAEALSESFEESMATLCFLFILRHPFIDKIIIGVQSKGELEELTTSYKRALELSRKNTLIDWDKYNCSIPALVDPTEWGSLKSNLK